MAIRNFGCFLIICVNIIVTRSQNDTVFLALKCQSQTESCSTCINTHKACTWCYDLNFVPERCDLRNNLLEANCKRISTVKESKMEIMSNKKFQDVADFTSSAVQIKPQKVKIQLRPGDEKTIRLQYRVAKNYPLDLYYLIDSTFTMKDDIETLVTLGDAISQQISDLTKHFRFGFGSFSDKVLLPFYKMDKGHLENPCRDQDQKCAPGFNFKHQFNFNSDVKAFITAVNGTQVTANLDNAEGGLDALMQIIVCTDTIGWQTDSRKLILILTNGLLHVAGDGKLAGVIKKCDGLCHLDKTGTYMESNMQDYPSLDHIYRELKQQKINVIFAVTQNVLNYYNKLNGVIPDYMFVTELHSDSSNILNVIKKGYIATVSTVSFQDNAKPPISLSYSSNCNKGPMNKTRYCSNVKEGEIYNFDVAVSFKHCPADRNLWRQKITIDEKNLVSEKLVIDLEMLCDCDCMKNEDATNNMCNDHGVINCGICDCDDGWSGSNCDCDLSNFENNRILENNCREITENTTSAMCHSRGDCECGKCLCEPSYTGKYCQCPTCKEVDGLQCGGPARGVCNCGKCLCTEEYTGEDCMCSLSTEKCVAPGDKKVCTDRGQCECGKCKCDTSVVFYSGQFCEKCSTCEGLCSLYRECVECSILHNCQGHECRHSEGYHKIDFVEELDFERTCSISINHAECRLWQYTYDFNKNHLIDLKIMKGCHTVSALRAQGPYYIFGGILVLGLLGLLAYKAKIVYDYKREYAEYMKNLLDVQYKEVNPLYVTPFRHYEVPRMKDE